MHFMWLIFLLWIEGTQCGDGWSWALRGPTLGGWRSVFPSLPSENKTFFLNQYFTRASRGTQEVNCLPANGWRWRWRWDSDFQNKHGEWSLANKSLHRHTHMHARAHICNPEPWSTARGIFWLARRDPRWPPKHPWCQGRELSRAQRYVLFMAVHCI